MRPAQRALASVVAITFAVTGCSVDVTSKDAETGSPSAAPTVTVTASPTSPPAEPVAPSVPGPDGSDELLPGAPRADAVDRSGEETPGFTSPSGNIACLFGRYDGATTVRCDIQEKSWTPDRDPTCMTDYGHAIELSETAELLCAGDTVLGIAGETDGARTLPYGQSMRYDDLSCRSDPTGVRCENPRTNAGFLLSRSSYRTWP